MVRRPDFDLSGGSASFTEVRHDLRPFYRTRHGLNAIPLGVNPGGSTGAYWNTDLHGGHSLLITPNGGGKGTSCIIPALLTYAGSTFCIDVKAENADITSDRRRAMGHRVVVLDHFHEGAKYSRQRGEKPRRTTLFNPLSFLNPRSRSFTDDVAAISEALVIGTPGENPHWPDSARQFVAGLIALAVERWGRRATFRTVRKLMNAEVPELIRLIKAVKKDFPNSLAADKLKRFSEESTTDEIKSVRSTAITQTDFLDSPDLADGMKDDPEEPFDLSEFATTRMTIYAVLPADKLTTHGRWLRMILALTLRAITRAPKPPSPPALIIADEMGTIGPLRPLEAGYGLLRGYGIRFMGVLQSLGQLKTDYPQSWSNFVNNCSVLQCLGARDFETASFFSELLGTTTLQEPFGEYLGRVANGANPLLQPRQKQGSRPLMYPHELATLLGHDPEHLERNTQLVMFRQGGINALLLQNPYYKQPQWRAWSRMPPQFASTPRRGFSFDRLIGALR